MDTSHTTVTLTGLSLSLSLSYQQVPISLPVCRVANKVISALQVDTAQSPLSLIAVLSYAAPQSLTAPHTDTTTPRLSRDGRV